MDRPTIAVTGHRPDKLLGYSASSAATLCRFAQDILRDINPYRVFTGMALGWDTSIAEAAIHLSIPFTAVIPFAGQEKRWEDTSQLHYIDLLAKADKIVTVSDGGFAAWKLHKRNQYLVDHTDILVALWNGSASGTGYTVGYARETGKPVVNVWEEWRKYATP